MDYNYKPTGFTTLDSDPLPPIRITPAHVPNRARFDDLIDSVQNATEEYTGFLKTWDIQSFDTIEELSAGVDVLWNGKYGDFMKIVDEGKDFQTNFVRTGHMDANTSSSLDVQEVDYFGSADALRRQSESIRNKKKALELRKSFTTDVESRDLIDAEIAILDDSKSKLGKSPHFTSMVKDVKWIHDYWLVDSWDEFARFVISISGDKELLRVVTLGIDWNDKLIKRWNSLGVLPKVDPSNSSWTDQFVMNPNSPDSPDLIVMGKWSSESACYFGSAPIYALCFDPDTFDRRDSPCLGSKLHSLGQASVKWLSSGSTYHVQTYATMATMLKFRTPYEMDWAKAPLASFISPWYSKGKRKVNEFARAFMVCRTVPTISPITFGELGRFIGWTKVACTPSVEPYRQCSTMSSRYTFFRDQDDRICKWRIQVEKDLLNLYVDVPRGDVPPGKSHRDLFPPDVSIECSCGNFVSYSDHLEHYALGDSECDCLCGRCNGSFDCMSFSMAVGVRNSRFSYYGYGIWREGKVIMPYLYASSKNISLYSVFDVPTLCKKAMEASGVFVWPRPWSGGRNSWNVATSSPGLLPLHKSGKVVSSPYWSDDGLVDDYVEWVKPPSVMSSDWSTWVSVWDSDRDIAQQDVINPFDTYGDDLIFSNDPGYLEYLRQEDLLDEVEEVPFARRPVEVDVDTGEDVPVLEDDDDEFDENLRRAITMLEPHMLLN